MKIKEKAINNINLFSESNTAWKVFLIVYFFLIITTSLYITYTIWAPIEGQLGKSKTITSYSIPDKSIIKYYENKNKSDRIPLEINNSTIKTSNGTVTTLEKKYLFNNQIETITTTSSVSSSIERETKLVEISIIFGILGASIHGFTSLTIWMSSNKLKRSYFSWFLTKPFIGGTLALIVYTLLRASLLSGVSSQGGMMSQQIFINDYGVAGISAIVGLMTGQMTQKLRDVFDTIFGISKGSDKGDITTTDNFLTVIPSELHIKKDEEALVGIAIKDNEDKGVKDTKVYFSISDTDKLITNEKGSKITDKNGLVNFKVRGKEEGETEIVVYCKLPEHEYMKSITVKIENSTDNISLSNNNIPQSTR
jgi:hypothetical protein